MLIDYPHWKYTHNLKVVKFEISKNLKSIEQKFKISRVFQKGIYVPLVVVVIKISHTTMGCT
jgi:hypothetical protein